jgi:hypothetical protein
MEGRMTLTVNGKERGGDPENFPLEDGRDPIHGDKIEPVQPELPLKKPRKFKKGHNFSEEMVKQAGPKRGKRDAD